MDIKIKKMGLTFLIAVIYAFLSKVFIYSFGDMMFIPAYGIIPLSAVYGIPAIIGVGIGALINGISTYFGPYYVIIDITAHVLASGIIYYYRERLALACIISSALFGLIWGSYVSWLHAPTSHFGESSIIYGLLIFGIVGAALFLIMEKIAVGLITGSIGAIMALLITTKIDIKGYAWIIPKIEFEFNYIAIVIGFIIIAVIGWKLYKFVPCFFLI